MSQEAEKMNGDLAQPDDGAGSDPPAESPNTSPSGGDAANSPPESANAAADGSNNRKRRRLSTPERQETPDWLPAGWTVENRVRTSGATAGSSDKYYCDPVSGHVFRSKNEVLYYLENGSKKRKRSSNNSPEADKTETTVSTKETTSHKKKNKKKSSGNSNTKNKKKPATAHLKFDFTDIPKKVVWMVSDFAEGSWTPFMDDKKVAESVSREWKAAFKFLA